MYSKEKLLEMLSSTDPEERWDACISLIDSKESSLEIVEALQKATNDTDKGVANKAKQALNSSIHHQEAIYLGLIKPDINDSETISKATPIEIQTSKNNFNQVILLNKLVDSQNTQNELLENIYRAVKFIIFWLLFILIVVGCSAYQIYERMGQMRLY